MKVGDLVMWIQYDQDHGMIGIIVDVCSPELNTFNQTTYDVLWADGTDGFDLIDCELMAVEDEEIPAV